MTGAPSQRRIVAIVLARGGSRAVPKKNLVSIGGRPLLEHTLKRALAAPEVAEVYVSTDSPEIAKVAAGMGATVIERPPELCTDTASSESGLLHCLDQIRAGGADDPELVVFLQPTSPLRSAEHITEALALFDAENADSLFSAGPLQGLAWRVEGDELIPVSYHPQRRVPRQQAPEYLAENGSIYIFKPWVLRREGCRLGGRIAVFRMAAQDSFEVDERDDVALVDFLLRRRHPDLVRETKT